MMADKPIDRILNNDNGIDVPDLFKYSNNNSNSTTPRHFPSSSFFPDTSDQSLSFPNMIMTPSNSSNNNNNMSSFDADSSFDGGEFSPDFVPRGPAYQYENFMDPFYGGNSYDDGYGNQFYQQQQPPQNSVTSTILNRAPSSSLPISANNSQGSFFSSSQGSYQQQRAFGQANTTTTTASQQQHHQQYPLHAYHHQQQQQQASTIYPHQQYAQEEFLPQKQQQQYPSPPPVPTTSTRALPPLPVHPTLVPPLPVYPVPPAPANTYMLPFMSAPLYTTQLRSHSLPTFPTTMNMHHHPTGMFPYHPTAATNTTAFKSRTKRTVSDAELANLKSSSPTKKMRLNKHSNKQPETVQQQQQDDDGSGVDSPMSVLSMDGDKNGAAGKTKHFLPSESVQVLKNWFSSHLDHPYPTSDEKEQLSKETGLSYVQVSNWFTNTRKRIWKSGTPQAGNIKTMDFHSTTP